VNVAVDEPWNHCSATGVEHARAVAHQTPDLGARADGDEPSVPDGYRLGNPRGGVDGDHLRIDDNDVGSGRGLRVAGIAT
jgi:hypothetical protein